MLVSFSDIHKEKNFNETLFDFAATHCNVNLFLFHLNSYESASYGD